MSALVFAAATSVHAQPVPRAMPPGEQTMPLPDGPPPPPGGPGIPSHWRPAAEHPAFMPDPRLRADWIAQCHARLSDSWDDDGGYWGHGRRHRRERADRDRMRCESYYDDYYAHYAQAMPTYSYAPPMAGCCMAGPAVRPGAPECTETVEYETVDAPARRVIRRAPRRVPDKRIRIAPDKRIRGS